MHVLPPIAHFSKGILTYCNLVKRTLKRTDVIAICFLPCAVNMQQIFSKIIDVLLTLLNYTLLLKKNDAQLKL